MYCDDCGRETHLGECHGIFQRLHERLRMRQLKGLATYGESIDESALDGLSEALDEALDLCVYLQKAIDQRLPHVGDGGMR